ncbi:SHOCT domain-containing protein [Listeria monocytogenes]|uniref:SHOCT-like domain-containing protein n=1 Tax=Lactococcus lactis subsp. lactis A12 TaxID=1137134 RepID=S6FSQ7_LACLL|nr:SHOCT domain-containing protein [Lactococcus lactis]EDO0154736.1 hypothetical protein [Listeria monocytogenes]EDO0664211.1 hypothetical protein [Listeria monocytogenes]EGF3687399.1 hypothetical protein [Listeria monocytogenes]EGF3711442.1 hypothetical protein [Listeria monocytogenes]EHH9428030.1 hypothetical protein [Listeria monocytogenes]
MNDKNEMLYLMSLAPAKMMLEQHIISNSDFKKIKSTLIEKYQPIIPKLLG